jgi:hypothetical protein
MSIAMKFAIAFAVSLGPCVSLCDTGLYQNMAKELEINNLGFRWMPQNMSLFSGHGSSLHLL